MIIGNVPAGPTDLVRQLVNLAVNAGRSLQSSQTGYIHYCHRVLDYPNFDTIPVVENFLFALSLLRERTAESFAEGKVLVDKLRHFQHASGNFPVYLHEFPECKDYYTAVHLLPIFYWILRTFPIVLGTPLRDEFQQTVERSFDYCLKLKEEKLPFIISLKLACGVKALAKLWERQDIEKKAEGWLDELRVESESPDFSGWFVPELLGEALVCLEMVYGDLVNSPWVNMWQHLRTVWHQRTASYVGPGYRDYQFREQPEVTMLDLVAGFHTGIYSYRALLNGPHMLQTALIHPTDEKLEPLTLPRVEEGTVAGRRWYQETQDLCAFSTLEKHVPDPSRDNAIAPSGFYGAI
jgi:hypothetical protein